jgi:hypothetical protein
VDGCDSCGSLVVASIPFDDVIDTYCCFEAKTTRISLMRGAQLNEPSDVSVAITIPIEFKSDESLYRRLKSQLQRTRQGLGGIWATLCISRINNDQVLEEIENELITSRCRGNGNETR